MYPYERFNCWITRRVLNRRFPESNVIETYRLSEWATFMKVSGQLPGSYTTEDSKQISEQPSANEETVCSTLSVEQMEDYQDHYFMCQNQESHNV